MESHLGFFFQERNRKDPVLSSVCDGVEMETKTVGILSTRVMNGVEVEVTASLRAIRLHALTQGEW